MLHRRDLRDGQGWRCRDWPDETRQRPENHGNCRSPRLAAVLVSDVCASGADIVACAHFLRNLGAEVGLSLCLAKSAQSQHPSPLQVAPEDIETQLNFMKQN